MIEILLISFYVISVILCGYCFYTLTLNELRRDSGIMNAGVLSSRVLMTIIPLVNAVVAIAYFILFLYNTEIKISMKGGNE